MTHESMRWMSGRCLMGIHHDTDLETQSVNKHFTPPLAPLSIFQCIRCFYGFVKMKNERVLYVWMKLRFKLIPSTAIIWSVLQDSSIINYHPFSQWLNQNFIWGQPLTASSVFLLQLHLIKRGCYKGIVSVLSQELAGRLVSFSSLCRASNTH